MILENAHAHVKLDYDEASKVQHSLGLQGFILLPFSAATPQSLDARVQDLVDYDLHGVSILDLAYTLGSRGRTSRNGDICFSHATRPSKMVFPLKIFVR